MKHLYQQFPHSLSVPNVQVYRGMNETPIPDYYVGINASCVINGNTYDLTRIQPNQFEISWNGSIFLTLGGGNLTLPSQCINEIDGFYVANVASFLANVLTENCALPIPEVSEYGFTRPCSDQWWIQGGIFNSGNATFATVQGVFNSVTESITNRMRMEGYDLGTNSSGLVYGTVIQTTTCIAFSWIWLLFPASHIALTGICLVITMVQTIYEVEKPLWKSSILPLLYASPGTQLTASGEKSDARWRRLQTRLQYYFLINKVGAASSIAGCLTPTQIL